MSDSAWVVVAIAGTCLLIFVLTVFLTPLIQRFQRRGLDSGSEPPMRKQFRTLGIICVGSAVATTLLAFADGRAVLYALAAVTFFGMSILAVKT